MCLDSRHEENTMEPVAKHPIWPCRTCRSCRSSTCFYTFYTANHSRGKRLVVQQQGNNLTNQHEHARSRIRHGEHHAKRGAYEPPRPTPSTAPSPAEWNHGADECRGVIRIEEPEPHPHHISCDEFHSADQGLFAAICSFHMFHCDWQTQRTYYR